MRVAGAWRVGQGGGWACEKVGDSGKGGVRKRGVCSGGKGRVLRVVECERG